jgi:hypothetical protein
VSISQTIIRNGQIDIRSVNKNDLRVIDKNGEYYLKGSDKELNKGPLSNMWIFYFKIRKPEKI